MTMYACFAASEIADAVDVVSLSQTEAVLHISLVRMQL